LRIQYQHERQCEARICLEVLFESRLVELRIVEGVERRSQTPESENQPQLGGDDVDDETEAYLAGECESGLGFPLDIGQRLAGREQVGDQIVAAIGRKGEVADLVGRVEGAPHQWAAGTDVPRPGIDEVAEGHVDTSLEAIQTALFDQFEAEPAKAKRRRVIIEVRAQDHAEPDIRET